MPVLVTGATGHLGNTLCRTLLDDGRKVRGLVRASSDRTPLKDLDVEYVVGNLLMPDSLEKAMAGCDTVFHTAAVYRTWAPAPEVDIIRPAVEGTRNVLEAAAKMNVRRLIYVSSVVAIGPGNTFYHHRDETEWNTEATLPYNIAKTRAEQLTHQLAEQLDLNVIFVLPTSILGPNDYKITPSTGMVRDFLNGKYPFYFDGAMSLVDVRDVARGMLLAEEKGKIGTRYILGGEALTIKDIFDQLAEMTTRSAPVIKLTRGLAKFIAAPMTAAANLFNFQPAITSNMVDDLIDCYYNFESTLAQEELGYEYRPAIRVLEETIGWLIERGEIPADLRIVENA